jgi:hypothetical protein
MTAELFLQFNEPAMKSVADPTRRFHPLPIAEDCASQRVGDFNSLHSLFINNGIMLIVDSQ